MFVLNYDQKFSIRLGNTIVGYVCCMYIRLCVCYEHAKYL